MQRRFVIGGVALATLLLSAGAVEAQRLPLSPPKATGMPVSPYFEGWWLNPDGSYTLSFGYFNRNTEEITNIPVGSRNFVEPAQYNGGQPEWFPTRRQMGVFTVTVPSSFTPEDRVVWTLRNANGQVHAVPGKIGIDAYELGHRPMAMGSLPPKLRLEQNGPNLHGPMGTVGTAPPVVGTVMNPLSRTARVGVPLTLTVWALDNVDGEEREPLEAGAGVSWFTHQGPAFATFSPQNIPRNEDLPRNQNVKGDPNADGLATVTATFPEAGEYLLRVRADNFNPLDSQPDDQCCWTNGYVRVTVTP